MIKSIGIFLSEGPNLMSHSPISNAARFHTLECSNIDSHLRIQFDSAFVLSTKSPGLLTWWPATSLLPNKDVIGTAHTAENFWQWGEGIWFLAIIIFYNLLFPPGLRWHEALDCTIWIHCWRSSPQVCQSLSLLAFAETSSINFSSMNRIVVAFFS